jgi:hypothetical protein|tara:strand:- start:456 stop:815 length:360 start_codon:yes stop_codon:yes gene_type:complete
MTTQFTIESGPTTDPIDIERLLLERIARIIGKLGDHNPTLEQLEETPLASFFSRDEILAAVLRGLENNDLGHSIPEPCRSHDIRSIRPNQDIPLWNVDKQYAYDVEEGNYFPDAAEGNI